MLVAEPSQLRKEIIRWHDDPAAALNWLDEHSAAIARCCRYTAKRHVRDKLAELFCERCTEELARGGGKRAVGQAVVRTAKGDDAGFSGVDGGGF